MFKEFIDFAASVSMLGLGAICVECDLSTWLVEVLHTYMQCGASTARDALHGPPVTRYA